MAKGIDERSQAKREYVGEVSHLVGIADAFAQGKGLASVSAICEWWWKASRSSVSRAATPRRNGEYARQSSGHSS